MNCRKETDGERECREGREATRSHLSEGPTSGDEGKAEMKWSQREGEGWGKKSVGTREQEATQWASNAEGQEEPRRAEKTGGWLGVSTLSQELAVHLDFEEC